MVTLFNNNRLKLLSFLVLFVFSLKSFGQSQNSLSATLSYLELKDEFNHGFVFRGPDINLNYRFEKNFTKSYFSYELNIAGGGKVANGSWGFRWFVKPFDASYLFRAGDRNIFIGPSISSTFDIQTYPDLHAGPIFWNASYGLDFKLKYQFKLANSDFECLFANNLISLVSRPDEDRDPYYFSSGLFQNLKDIHQNMTIKSVSKFIDARVELNYFPSTKNNKLAIGYYFSYTGNTDPPKFIQYINGIQFRWYLNQSEDEK